MIDELIDENLSIQKQFYVLGLDSIIVNNHNDLHILMFDIDTHNIDIDNLISNFRSVVYNVTGNDSINVLIYKTKHGYHLLSLNMYRLIDFINIGLTLETFKIPISHKHLTFALGYKKATLRISPKDKDEPKYKFIRWGPGIRKISKGHYIIYNEMFDHVLLLSDKEMLEDTDISLTGYYWDSKGKLTFENTQPLNNFTSIHRFDERS